MEPEKNKSGNCSCHHKSVNPTVEQTLTELDFERGIWSAVLNKDIAAVKKFVEKQRANERDMYGYSALHYAARQGSESLCQLLIERGQADVNAVTNGGATPLHRSAMMGHLNVIKLLVNSNAKLDIQDADGQTALHRAAANGHFEASKYLSEQCTCLKLIKDINGHIPFDLIPQTGNDELKSLLTP